MPAVEEKKVAKLKPFTVSFDDRNNGTIHLGIIGQSLRGRWSRETFIRGRERMRSIGDGMNSMPEIPGVQLSLKAHPSQPGVVLCVISDPLTPERLSAISKAEAASSLIGSGVHRKAVPTSEFTLDADKAKTLLLDLRQRLSEGTAILESGMFPADEELDALPGEELYDPLNTITAHPRTLREYREWKERRWAPRN